MTDETHLDDLLASLNPVLGTDTYVFCTFPDAVYGEFFELSPIGCFQETEGLTLIITEKMARQHKIPCSAGFRAITLGLQSDLSDVGLTAAVSRCLADAGISANVVAAFHHDHIFVPADRAEEALEHLTSLSARSG